MKDERWRKLAVKEKELELIPGEFNITVKGLAFKELGKMAQYHERGQNEKALEYLLECTLKKAPEVDDEDIPEIIESISADVAGKILSEVQKFSGIGDDKVKNDESTD